MKLKCDDCFQNLLSVFHLRPSTKGPLAGGVTDQPRDYLWTLTLTGSVKHTFSDELKINGLVEAVVTRDPAYGGAVQVDPGFPQLTPRLLSTLETEI